MTARRLIDLDESELRAIVREEVARLAKVEPVEWLDVDGVCALTGYSRAYVNGLCRGEHPIPHVGSGRRRRFRRAEVEAWLRRAS